MFQTWWDVNRQNIRKAIDALSGAVAGWLIAQGQWGGLLVPFLMLAINYGWFWLDNQSKITVAGLEKAGESHAALTVEQSMGAKDR